MLGTVSETSENIRRKNSKKDFLFKNASPGNLTYFVDSEFSLQWRLCFMTELRYVMNNK